MWMSVRIQIFLFLFIWLHFADADFSWWWNGKCEGVTLDVPDNPKYCDSIEECRKRCRATEKCNYFSFTFTGDECELFETCPCTDQVETAFSHPKYGGDPWPFNEGCFMKAACPDNYEAYRKKRNVETGYDCAALCDRDPSCKMWTFRQMLQRCDLFHYKCKFNYEVLYPKSGFKGCSDEARECCQPSNCSCCMWPRELVEHRSSVSDPKLPEATIYLADPPSELVNYDYGPLDDDRARESSRVEYYEDRGVGSDDLGPIGEQTYPGSIFESIISNLEGGKEGTWETRDDIVEWNDNRDERDSDSESKEDQEGTDTGSIFDSKLDDSTDDGDSALSDERYDDTYVRDRNSRDRDSWTRS